MWLGHSDRTKCLNAECPGLKLTRIGLRLGLRLGLGLWLGSGISFIVSIRVWRDLVIMVIFRWGHSDRGHFDLVPLDVRFTLETVQRLAGIRETCCRSRRRGASGDLSEGSGARHVFRESHSPQRPAAMSPSQPMLVAECA